MTPLMLLACAGGEPDILAEPSAESGGQMRALSATPPATNPRTVSGPASRGGTRATTPAATPPTGVTIPVQTASTWRVRLAGNAAAGTGARVEVRLNGVEIARGDISHASPFEYTLTTPALLPGATLDISLTNATAADGTPLRWLWVDYIALPNLTIRPSDAHVVFDAGDGAAAYDGQDLSRPGERMTRNGALRFTIPAGTVAAEQMTPQAAGVYIDAQRGHDANDGSFASPWQSFRHLRTASLPAGHGIYLRCDSVFADALELTAAQIKDNTQIAGYGPECVTRKATITGADRFAGDWTKTGQMWSRALPANTAKISQLFINGKPQRVAQWPNSGPTASMDGTASALTNQPSNAEAGTAASKAGSAQVQIQATDAGTLASKDLIGATAQLRTQPWLIETRKLKAGTGSQLQLDRATDWPLPPGQPFLLQDKFWMLDSPGEFFHDTQAQRLYLMAPAEWAHSDLNALVVEGTTRDVALSVTGPSGVQIRDLALVAAATTGLALHNAPQAKVERIEARDNAVNGVRISQWPRLTASLAPAAASVVSDSLVQGNGLYGIDASQAEHTQVLRNRVLDTGVAAHQQAGVMAAIANGVGGRTDDNEIVGSAYLGIRFSSLRASQVQRNTISSYCLRLSDCGGIYTWTGTGTGPESGGAVVAGNRVLAEPARFEPGHKALADIKAGIYIDDRSHGVTVQDNLVTHAPTGVLVHNASRTTVHGNRLWMNSRASVWVTMDDVSGPPMLGNVFHNNTLVPRAIAQTSGLDLPGFDVAHAFWFWDTQIGEQALQSTRNHFYNNTVVQLYGHAAGYAWLRGPQGERDVDVVEWQALNASAQTVRRPARYEVVMPVVGAEKVVNGGFDGGMQSWTEHRSPAGWGGTTQWLHGQSGCLVACPGFTAGDRGDLLGSQAFTMKPGVPHVYRLTATMPDSTSATVGRPFIGREGTPWDQMSDGRGYVSSLARRAAPGETLHYSAFFVPKAAAPARVFLQLETLRQRVGLDNVSVREVLGFSLPAPGELSAVAVAPTERAQKFQCEDLGWPANCAATDLSGMAVSFPITVAAQKEQFLLRVDTVFRH